ncbi:MAG: hypothetical protein AAFY25_09740 [Pseudomonadota bacterium]
MQRGLAASRVALRPNLSLLLQDDIRNATLISRRYSVNPQQKGLEMFGSAFAACLMGLNPVDKRPLLISAEALSGQIPGRKHFHGYHAAPALMAAVVKALRHKFGQTVPIRIWFSTRQPGGWMKSVYYQNVRTARVTEGFDSYARKLEQASRLDDIVQSTRDMLQGEADVRSTRLEDSADLTLGLMGLALKQLRVDTNGVKPPSKQNAQVAEVLEQLLDMNRSSLSDEDLSVAKNDFLHAVRKSGEYA